MKPINGKKQFTLKDQQGMALLTAILVMAMLTILGIAGIYLSKTDIMISRNFRIIKKKFFTAEAALEQGINILRATPVEDWNDDFLNGATQANPDVVLPGMSSVSFYGMTYTVRVKNNLDDPVFLDANYTVDEQFSTDTDEILVIIAEANSGTGQTKMLESAVQWIPKPATSYGGKDITTENTNTTTAEITW